MMPGFWKYTLYSPEGGEVCDYTVSNQDLENLSFKRSYMGDGKFLYKKMDGTKEVCVLVEPELGKETELNVSGESLEDVLDTAVLLQKLRAKRKWKRWMHS